MYPMYYIKDAKLTNEISSKTVFLLVIFLFCSLARLSRETALPRVRGFYNHVHRVQLAIPPSEGDENSSYLKICTVETA